MKTIIGENKLHDVISKYIDDYLEGNEINWTYGYGGYYTYYTGETKEGLLEEVLDRHYQVCRKHVEIIEYPTIKIY